MEEIKITDDIKLSCGHCDSYLGTFKEISTSQLLNVHVCLQNYTNVTVDVEACKLWGTEPVDKKGREPYCSKSCNESPSCSKQNLENVWSNEAIKLLICLYKENKNKFESPMYNKRQVWEMISKDLQKSNIFISALKCDEKWRNLKKTYDKVLKTNNTTGESPTYWKFYEDLRDIYFNDPHFSPKCTVSSSGVVKRRYEEDPSDAKNSQPPKKKDDQSKNRDIQSKKKEKKITLHEAEEKRQKRHEEKMQLKQEMFQWFKENIKKE